MPTSCASGLGLLLVTLVAGSLQAMGEQRRCEFLGRVWSLDGASGVLLYLLGFAGEVFVLASIYLVMPVGRLSWRACADRRRSPRRCCGSCRATCCCGTSTRCRRSARSTAR